MSQPEMVPEIDSEIARIPARPQSQWPIGVRLRFRPDAEMNETHAGLRGKSLLVLSALRLIGPKGGTWSWRQQVLSLTTGRIGWARPDQLDLPIDDESRVF